MAWKSFPSLTSNQAASLLWTGYPAHASYSQWATSKLSSSCSQSSKISRNPNSSPDMFPPIITRHIPPLSIPTPFITKCTLLFKYFLLHNKNQLRSISIACIRWLDLPKSWIRYLLDSPTPPLLASQSTPPAGSTFYQLWPGTLKLSSVGLSPSFLIVDVHRSDSPIVYASPGFISLTGYSEHEIIGRNCRFLQAPDGNVVEGEERRFTSHSSVAQMKEAAVANMESQTCLINYKKNGTPFMNLVSIVPLPGSVHNSLQIGFQINLSVQ